MNLAVGAIAFVWLGMVLALSFLEAPLKFRAPGITVPLGLGIGRLVFRALNAVEVALLLGVGIALYAGPRPSPVGWAASAVALLLLVQLGAVRPALAARTRRVLAGDPHTGSRAHLAYVALEILKVGGLVVLGLAALGIV
ncbi:hypothetical protein GCM10023215_37640 [Pseudonocardia yuanmonensis]|uniref:Transmembrane protein n=1 Tax=Pseudonocardia yuanmonensis TaxID=1095914 RepID=A0ABP8WX66_9PSEU